MIATLISIIFAVIILGVLWWAVQQMLPLIPMAEPFRTILRVLVVLVTVFIVLYFLQQILGVGLELPRLHY